VIRTQPRLISQADCGPARRRPCRFAPLRLVADAAERERPGDCLIAFNGDRDAESPRYLRGPRYAAHIVETRENWPK
jgi:hypothetical protein